MSRRIRVRLLLIAVSAIAVIAIALLASFWLNSSRLVDCVWSATAEAWVDENENGIRDATEAALPDVVVHVDDVFNGYKNVSQSKTGIEGSASLGVLAAGCPVTRFEVYVDTPDGYRPTTPDHLPGNGTGPFRFGFVKVTGP